MAISDTKKVDYLWKKIGFGAAKTDTNAAKKAPNEAIFSPLLLRGDNVWVEDGSIPGVMPGSSSGVVTVYPTSSPNETTNDNTSAANRTWKTGLTDWIPPEYGSTYGVKVYIHTSGNAASAASGGDQVFATGSGNNDEWYFDYQAGILHFIGTNLPNGISFSGKSVYVSGARYTGTKGVKSYVNSQVSGAVITLADDASNTGTITTADDTLTFAGGNSITSTLSGDTVTFALNKAIDVNTISSSDSSMLEVQDSMRVTGSLITNIISSDDSTALTVNDSLIVANSLSFQGGVSVSNILDEDNMASNSATALATQQSIKAYVDSQISGSNTITLGDDASSVISLDLDGILNVKGGNSITSVVNGDTLTFKLDDVITVDEITAKDSSAININSPIQVRGNINTDTSLTIAGATVTSIKDEDNFASNSATALATQQSIKAYVDSVSGGSLALGDNSSNSGAVNINAGDNLEFRSGNSITMTVAGNGVTAALNDAIVVNSISSSDSTFVRINDNLETENAKINTTLNVEGDAQIKGNLTVQGTTTYIETTNTKITDPLLLLNNGNSGGSDLDSGIMVERGSAGNNAVFYWNEGDDVFKAVTSTSAEGATSVTDTALANIRVATPSNANDAATKGYVDSATSSIVTTIGISDSSSTSSTLTLGTNDLEFRAGNSITPTVAGTGVTFALNKAIDVDTISSSDSTAVTVNDGLIVVGSMSFDGGVAVSTILDEDNMASNSATALVTQQSLKAYVDAQVGGVSQKGNEIELGSPADSSTFPVGAISTLSETAKVTDAIDDLNEALENVRNNTFVKSVDFTADVTSGGAGLSVTLTITAVGNANRYDITWGDGDTTIGTTDTTPTKTYSSNVGSPFDVTVRAYNNAGQGTGSEATETKADFITIFTANPVVQFEFYAASSGGSAITKTNLGSTVYLKNTTTNTTGVTATFSIDWGDGVTETISANNAAGGVDGARLAHTYDRPDAGDSSTSLQGDGDLRFAPRLVLLTHQSADPTQIPKSSSSSFFYAYTTHEPLISVDGSTIRGVNEEGAGGFAVTFNNDTITRPGAHSIFNTNSGSNTYVWDFGDKDSTVSSVNVGSGSAGDTAVDISKTFGLETSEQTAGTTKTYTTTLTINNGHTSSPFTTNLNIIVEPDVRANLSATSDVVSTASGDNARDLYDVTDLDGANRASVTYTNTSQNADDYEYDFFNDSSDVLSVTQASNGAGSTSATLTKNFTGRSNGSFTTDFKAAGTPDTIHQTDSETITFTMNAVPSAPANLSSKSLTLSDSAQGTNPHLCASFDDATSSFATLSAGDSLETTTARRYTSGTIDTNTVTNFLTNNSNGTGATVNQTITAKINNADRGNRAMTTSEGGANNSTFTSLVTTNHRDFDEVDNSYPQRLYLVATAKITQALSDYTAGLNAQRIESSAGGNTNLVYVLRDLLTGTPTTTIGTVAEGTAGSKRYISGLPYYNTGSPTVTITGTTIANFTGQAYQDASDPHEVDPGTSQESTSGNVIGNTNFTYANIDGASTMLSGGIPVKNTGVGSAYTIGAVTVPITSSSISAVQRIKARSKNANGTGGYSESNTNIQVFTSTPSGLDKEDGGITVSDSLGAGFDDDAVRIYGPNAFYSTDSSTVIGDTPNFNSGTNFYTTHPYQGSTADVVEGTDEAICRFGTVGHSVVNYSSGYLPVGPNLSTQPRDSGTAQYYTIAFRRTTMANFTITLSGRVSGCFIAAPGTAIDSASGLNGWLDAGVTYGGSGVPGSNTGSGGNGSNGCAFTSGDRIIDNTTYSGSSFTLTLGSENATNATGNVVLVRFKLEAGDSITAVSIA